MPVSHVGPRAAPVLIGHGEQDRNIAPSHSSAFVAAMKAAGAEATLLLWPDEGRSPAITRAKNRVEFYGALEKLLKDRIGLSEDPVRG